MKTTFNAPWGSSLKWISALATLLLIALSTLLPVPPDMQVAWWTVRLFAPALILGSALFTVRSYEIRDGVLWVQRLLWKTRIPIGSLNAVEFRPGRFGWAIRLFGNGGLYSFSGWYYQKPLLFRALATRISDAVILKFSDRHPVVVTPNEPEEFAKAIRREAIRLNLSKPE